MSAVAEQDLAARFGAVGLDDLVSEAALLTRVDRKYVVPRAALPTIVQALHSDTRALEIAGARDFAYRSVYFDTPELLSFHLAARPRRRRFKIRTRSYEDTGGAFLEIKTRGARGMTAKERAEYRSELDRLPVEAHAEIEQSLSAIGLGGSVAARLQPTLTSTYRRATLLGPDGARATVDTDLTWFDANGPELRLPMLAIVETKSAARASDADRVLWRQGHRPVSVSKYATGLAALRPALPRNRWSRLLRGPFSA
jgi:hypothetical protein